MILGQEDLLETDMASHANILARKVPWTEEPGGLWSMGLQSLWGHTESGMTELLCTTLLLLPQKSTVFTEKCGHKITLKGEVRTNCQKKILKTPKFGK